MEKQHASKKVPEYFFVRKTFEELSAAELYEIVQLRIAVFVVEQNCPFQDCDDLDLRASHLMLYDVEDNLCAYARYYFLSEPNTVHIGRVVVKKTLRMNGLGRLLMDRVLTEIRKNTTADSIEISAQLYLKRFYEDFGFEIEGRTYSEDRIIHVKMIKSL